MQRGSIEHEQIIYESSNRRMKQLMDWLSNSHWTPDTGIIINLISTTCGYAPSSSFKQQHSPGPAKRFGLSALHQLKTDENYYYYFYYKSFLRILWRPMTIAKPLWVVCSLPKNTSNFRPRAAYFQRPFGPICPSSVWRLTEKTTSHKL